MAADLKGKAAGGSELGSHHRRAAQNSSPADAAAPGGPAKRMKKLMEGARAPVEIPEFMYSGRRLNMLRQTYLSLACVGSGNKRQGLFSRPRRDALLPA